MASCARHIGEHYISAQPTCVAGSRGTLAVGCTDSIAIISPLLQEGGVLTAPFGALPLQGPSTSCCSIEDGFYALATSSGEISIVHATPESNTCFAASASVGPNHAATGLCAMREHLAASTRNGEMLFAAATPTELTILDLVPISGCASLPIVGLSTAAGGSTLLGACMNAVLLFDPRDVRVPVMCWKSRCGDVLCLDSIGGTIAAGTETGSLVSFDLRMSRSVLSEGSTGCEGSVSGVMFLHESSLLSCCASGCVQQWQSVDPSALGAPKIIFPQLQQMTELSDIGSVDGRAPFIGLAAFQNGIAAVDDSGLVEYFGI